MLLTMGILYHSRAWPRSVVVAPSDGLSTLRGCGFCPVLAEQQNAGALSQEKLYEGQDLLNSPWCGANSRQRIGDLNEVDVGDRGCGDESRRAYSNELLSTPRPRRRSRSAAAPESTPPAADTAHPTRVDVAVVASTSPTSRAAPSSTPGARSNGVMTASRFFKGSRIRDALL